MTNELIIKSFESVGISKTQAIVYLDLLKNKESTAIQISKRTRVSKANVYNALTKLNERNLVNSSNKEEEQMFSALPIDLIINEKKERLENLKSSVDYINTTYVAGQAPKVYTLEGLKTIKNILSSLLEKKLDIWIYGLAENENITKILNDSLMHSFHIERIKKQIPLKLLFSKIPSNDVKILNSLKFTQARLLPPTKQPKTSQITQIVCDGSVYITLWINPIYTIVIENDVIAKKYLNLYKILWDTSKDL